MESRYLEFVYLLMFENTAKGLLDEEDRRVLELELLEDPERGTVQGGTGGVRKVRFALGNRGKSGGARVVYLYVEIREKIYFVLVFPKNVQVNLTGEQKKRIRDLVATLKEES